MSHRPGVAMNPQRAGRPSLRRRLAWTFMALAIAVAFTQAAIVYITGNRSEEAMIDSIATEQLRLSMVQYRQDPASAQPNTPDMRLYVTHEGDTAALPAWLQSLPPGSGSWEVHPSPGIEYHVAAQTQDGLRFHLVYDVADHERRQDDVLAILALSVVVIALLALAASDRIARRLTGDLERLSEAVRRDRASAMPSTGLAAIARHAESSDLAEALDERCERLQAAIDRERAFSAAASHELRTPLMQAASTLELLGEGELSPAQRRRVEQLRASVTEITMLTGGLLRVARGLAAQPCAPIDLHRVVEEICSHLQRDARARAISMRSDVPAHTRIAADRDALWIVLVNLVRNAIRHSGGSLLTIDWDGTAIRVRDDGRGFDVARAPASLGRDAVRAAPEGVSGLGIGLAIVERICEAAGWTLQIESACGEGTQVRIGLAGA